MVVIMMDVYVSGTAALTSIEQCVYAIGHACLLSPDRTSGWDEMSDMLREAGAFDRRSRENFLHARQAGLATYVAAGHHVAAVTRHFTLTERGWAKFEGLRNIPVDELVSLTRRCVASSR